MGIVGGTGRSAAGGSSAPRKGIVGGRGPTAEAEPAKPPKQSNLMKLLNALDYGRRAGMAVVKEVGDLVPALPGDARTGKGADDGFSLGDLRKNFNANIGAGDMIQSGNKWVDRGVGLAGDIAFDPLTYLTFGMSTGAKVVGAGGKLAKGSVKAKDVARQAIAAGDDELAERVMSRGTRGSVNAMTKKEALEYGVRQGPVFGVGKAKAALPGGDALARTVSDALAKSTVSTRMANARVGTGLASNVKAAATPVARMIARDSNRANRLAAAGTANMALGSLNRIVKEAGDSYDAKAIRDSMEGVGAPNDIGNQITGVIDGVHQWASTKLGRDLPRLNDYLSHRLTTEARDMKSGAPNKRAGGIKTPTVLKQRGHRAGDIFYGQELKDGSLSEMNAIFQKATGRKHNYYEDDPAKIAKQYVSDLTRMVAKSEEAFATEAIKRTGKGGAAIQKEIIPDEAKQAMKEVNRLAKEQKKTVGKLADNRLETGIRTGAAAENDAAALAAVKDANLTAKGGNPFISKAADDYAARAGMPPLQPVDRGLKVDPEFAARIAKAYDELPFVDPAAEGAYRAMADETLKQFNYITRELKIKVVFQDADPYKSAQEMMADIAKNKTLKVYKTADDQLHPFLSTQENNMFRAVHDFFGHAHAGNRFDRHGEEVAYRLHSQMYSPEARRAMATETRGQNSYLNFSEANIARRAKGLQAEFPDQKAALLPDEFVTAMPRAADEVITPTPGTYVAPGLLAEIPDLKTQLAVLKAAVGRDNRVASQELLDLVGARRIPGEKVQGENAIQMADGAVIPERNIASHVDPILRLADRLKQKADMDAAKVNAREAVYEKLRPQVMDQARTLDHALVATDPEALMAEAADNARKLEIVSALPPVSKDKKRVEAFKKAEADKLFRERAAFLFEESARLRAAGDDELAAVAALEGQARKMEADLTDLDRKWEKAMSVAGTREFQDDIEAMVSQGLARLADGRYAEPWVAEAAKQMADAMTPHNAGKLLTEFDRMSQWWRASALLSPGYHGRNTYGAMFNNMLAGMDWARYPEYRKYRKLYDKGGIEAMPAGAVRDAWEIAETQTNFLKGQDISDLQNMIGGTAAPAGRLATKLGRESGSIVGRNNPVFAFNFKIAEKVEASVRMPLFVDAYIKAGGKANPQALDSAIDSVMRYHFDYADLSKGEQEVGRRAFGFYTWARNNLPLMMAEIANKPGKFTRYSHLKRNMELGEEEDPQKPGYFNKLMAIQVPGAKWKGNQIYWTPDLPFISAAGTAGEGWAGLLSNLNPIIKTPLESVTNRKFFEDRNFSDTLRPGPTDPAFGTVLQVLARLPKGIPGVPRMERGKDGSVLMDEREMNKIESMMPLLARMRRLTPTEDKYQERVLTSWLSFALGIGARTLDENMRGGEMARRKEAAAKQRKRQAKIEGGRTLADYEAAQRQAKAIKAAQEGRNR